MRKASTTRSDRRARVRSSGGTLMMVCYVTLKDMYIEHLRLPCPRKEGVVRISNACLQRGNNLMLERREGFKIYRDMFAMLTSG